MQFVKPKKHLGQHFLKDENIARKTVTSFTNALRGCSEVLEIGPGTGMLTQLLIKEKNFVTHVIEIDRDAVAFLNDKYPNLHIIEADFLKADLSTYFQKPFAVIGNFPYNISSQILFKVLEYRNQIPVITGMFQKEVAERIISPPGSKNYGILSVLMQAFYNIEYLFTVNEQVFYPPPKVKSAVMRFIRNDIKSLNCNEALFFKVVKTSFNHRRKTLRNALIPLLTDANQFISHQLLNKRAEQLSVEQFIELTNLIGDKS